MRTSATRWALCLVMTVACPSLFAAPAATDETAPAETKRETSSQRGSRLSTTQITLDLALVGGEVALAKRTGKTTYVGAGTGIGGNILNAMLLAGGHFSQNGFLSYEDRDAYDGEFLYELVNLHVFVRKQLSPRWRYDLGIQGALLLHFDDSDDDPGGASFVGVYLAPLWGGDLFQIGPRMRMGVFAEPDLREFGINVELVRGRIVFDW